MTGATLTRRERGRLREAAETIARLSDRELRDLLCCGRSELGDYYLVAAIASGRRAPSDLAGRRPAYRVPISLPWHHRRERERERHCQRLLRGVTAEQLFRCGGPHANMAAGEVPHE